jgi:glutamate 5-kinase
MGTAKLNLKERPKDIAGKQAAAAVGQCELMYIYDKEFGLHNHTVAQILLTGADVRDENRCLNFINTTERLLHWNALPIINENDTVATDEIVIGDNDTLAAIVATSLHADLLILLTDIDGLYTANPRENPEAELIPVVEELTPEIIASAGGKGSSIGTGGMQTKLIAARMVMDAGCDMVIAQGENPAILYDILDGASVGTRFIGKR